MAEIIAPEDFGLVTITTQDYKNLIIEKAEAEAQLKILKCRNEEITKAKEKFELKAALYEIDLKQLYDKVKVLESKLADYEKLDAMNSGGNFDDF